MQNRIVEIASDGAHVSARRGFLVIRIDSEEAGQIAVDDIGALVVRGHGASFSVNICERLSAANVPIVICGNNQSPASVIWPVSGHFAQGLHMQAQASVDKPLLKRLWAQLIRQKIVAQADVLASFGMDCQDLREMAKRVKSGDSNNLEAQAARRYWSRLMGEGFHRDRSADGINAALNYGYTVLRAATARAILAAGLHPSLSINHQSRGNALRLADDLMEPFRPYVDQKVRSLVETTGQEEFQLTPEIKMTLAGLLNIDFQSQAGASPMQVCIDRMAQSLTRVYLKQERDLELPSAPLPLFQTVLE